MAGAVPRSLLVATVISLVVAVGALTGAAALRWRAAQPEAAATTTESPRPSSPGGVSGCLVEPCRSLATTTVGGTSVELVADAGSASGRVRIGGANASQVIETTITDMGVLLSPESLQCLSGGPAACLVRGEHDGGLAGQVIVGRSDSWNAFGKPFVSTAGYLALANADGDAAPEVLAAQHDCGNLDTDCASRPVFVQVFDLSGAVVGCGRNYPRVDRLPGFPTVAVLAAQLTPCR